MYMMINQQEFFLRKGNKMNLVDLKIEYDNLQIKYGAKDLVLQVISKNKNYNLTKRLCGIPHKTERIIAYGQ